MDAPSHQPRGTATRFELPDRAWRIAVLAIGAAALLARLVGVLRGAGLHGDFGYDDGVYYAAAAAFLHGLLPYRDVVLVHPPGIVVVLAPFAWLGTVTSDATGLAAARLAFMAIGALNAALVALVAGRISRPAGVVAGVVYALWHVPVAFERTTILLAPQSALLLGSLLVLAPRPGSAGSSIARGLTLRRAAAAGALLGLAGTIQLWAVVPWAVVAAWLVIEARSDLRLGLRRLLAFAVGAAAAGGAVVLPFALAAGPPIVRMTVLDQLFRPPLGVPLVDRLRALELGTSTASEAFVPGPIVIVAAVAGVAFAVALARWLPSVRGWLAIGSAQVLFVLAGNVFFPHYSAWPAPALALVIGAGGAALLERLRPRPVLMVGAGLCLVAAVAAFGLVDARRSGTVLPIAALRADLASADCVAADAPTLLIETGWLRRDLDAGCDPVVDPTGVSYDTDRGALAGGEIGASRAGAPEYQAAMLAYYGSAQAAMFERLYSDGLTNATWSALQCRLPVTHVHKPVTVLLEGGGAKSCP